MLNNIPEFDYLLRRLSGGRSDKEPVAASYSAPGVLAEAEHETGRAKGDFELREISKEEYEAVKRFARLSKNSC
jgi:hypothetical protein